MERQTFFSQLLPPFFPFVNSVSSTQSSKTDQPTTPQQSLNPQTQLPNTDQKRQKFLSELLSIENTVPADEGEEWMVCKNQYGTPSPGTSTSEKKICLPCDPKHTVGSTSITTCLQKHNTCPIYHHELDPGIGLPQMQHLSQKLCNALGFNAPDHPVRDIAGQVAKRVWYSEIIQAEPTHEQNFNLAAACVYMASNLVFGRVRVKDIVGVSLLSREGINDAYSMMLEELDDILDEQLCWRVGMYNLAVAAV